MTQATQTQAPEYRNIITTAFGFINRLRSVETDDGEYLSLAFNAQYGKKDKNGKFKTSRFSLNVKSSEVEDILRDVMQDYSPEDDKLCASLHIGDIRPHLVTNPDGTPYLVYV